MKKRLIKTLFLILLLGVAYSLPAAIPALERSALIALYNSSSGDSWTTKTGWKDGTLEADGFALIGTEGTWHGITVASDHVTQIALNYNNLSGTLPTQLGDLPNLWTLSLYQNHLIGLIPTQLGSLSALQTLFLQYNQLSGNIPIELGSLSNLGNLALNSNQLTGAIPSQLGSLTNLWNCYLDNNQLSGNLPAELGNLINVHILMMYSNQLTGNIPTELGNLTSVQYLGIHYNQLSGSIPGQLGNNTNLIVLNLSFNQLSGSIPPELGNLANLMTLNLSYNQLSGAIPIQLANLANLNELYLYSNLLSGNIPAQLGNLTNLVTLELTHNQLDGNIPYQLGNLDNLYYLDLASNQLEGSIPYQLGNLSNLYYMMIQSNMLIGEVPLSFLNLTNLVDACSDFGYNALHTSYSSLRTFLNTKQAGGDFEATQTVAPTGLLATPVNSTTIDLSWTPIVYTGDTGRYRIYYNTVSGGPYTYYDQTSSKSTTGMQVPGLTPGQSYYFMLRTRTDPHAYNQNTVDSEDSAEVSTSGITPSVTVNMPNGSEDLGAGATVFISWSYTGSVSNVKIEYSTNNGSSYSTVVASQPAGSPYLWTVPNTPSTTCLVRISDASNSAINDISDAVFTISSGTGSSYYNSPASRLIITEVNWAPASGGGNWISEVQITDVTGGSTVQVYYNSGTTRLGSFTLWTNSSGANASVKFSNILQSIDGLDSGSFVYYGTSGALEFVTQDTSHLLQAAVRTFNGNYSRTFPALADNDTNTATLGKQLIIPNISNNSTYRPSVVLFNPSSEIVDVNVVIVDGGGSQIGSIIHRTLAGYEMNVITAEVRADTYDNACIYVIPTGSSGRIMASGQSANNVTNDPAAHLAVQWGSGYANSPGQMKFLTEVNWAPASGGGEWISEVQIIDRSIGGGAVVQVYYDSGTTRHGPFTLWTNWGAINSSVKFANILSTIDGLDSGSFVYYGTSGSLEFVTQDSSHLIQAAVRTCNGNFSRTFPALSDLEANTAASGRTLIIPNISNNTTYRPSVVLFNPSADSVSCEVKIIGSSGAQIGSTITRTVAGYEMNVITTEVRANTYDNAFIQVQVTSGSGRLLVSGQTANNVTNDPAAHVAVQGQ